MFDQEAIVCGVWHSMLVSKFYTRLKGSRNKVKLGERIDTGRELFNPENEKTNTESTGTVQCSVRMRKS